MKGSALKGSLLRAGFGAWYYTKRKYAAALLAAERKAGSSEGQEHLAKEEHNGGSRRGPLGGQLGGAIPPNQGGISPREANPDKVAAMLAAMKADAARARSQRLPSLKLPDKPGVHSAILQCQMLQLYRLKSPCVCT